MDPVGQWARAFLLDSDVAIEHLRGRPWTGELFRTIAAAGGGVCYSPVTAAEIYHGVRPGEEEATARLFASLPCIPVDHGIGEQAGQYLRRYRASHGLALGDALIAATAHVHDLVLLTRNRRHYPMPELRLGSLPIADA
ncbi:MAG: type II toxin-antitoxin system VapC family toxin [Chloroflexota bacterium]|nr:type II toxin-antitoxin system VapC family toxin [Chloroflexota bacterium]